MLLYFVNQYLKYGMREFMQIVEGTGEPTWFANGERVDINAYDEAQDFLEDEEWGYEWKLCTVPVELLTQGKPFAPMATHRETEQERVDTINHWATSKGGLSTALLENPPIAFLKSSGLELVDGYHRIGLATDEMDTIPCLVGKPNEIDEKAPPTKKGESFVAKHADDFKARYGDNWKAVLYATAWKRFSK
jgi:hypothetical protein